MENIIAQFAGCKLTDLHGDYRLYTMSSRNYDGYYCRDIVHVMTFYGNGYIRNERTGATYKRAESAYELAMEAYFAECDRIRGGN